MTIRPIFRPLSILFLFTGFSFFAVQDSVCQVTGQERDVAVGMLETVADAVKKNYFDPGFRGVDVNAIVEESKAKLRKANTRDELMLIVAASLVPLGDSHTNFYPPARSATIDYGWRLGIIGNECHVVGIKPKTDAEVQGLKVGDQVITVDGFAIGRENLFQLYHRYFALAPRSVVQFVVLRPGERQPRTINVRTKIDITSTRVSWEDVWVRILRKGWDVAPRDRFVEFGKDLLIWRMNSFVTSEIHISETMKKARGFKTLILDLRDNGGGYVEIEKQLVSYFFDRDIKIGEEKGRKETKPRFTKNKGSDTFKGDVMVLVDHDSASAAEVFARTIQLEKRGIIIGDRTAGAVMTSRFFPLRLGVGTNLYFGASITVFDVIMPDGRSLEKMGVAPDELIYPSASDLANNLDPVLSYAAKKAGVDITPEKAGTFFPVEWR